MVINHKASEKNVGYRVSKSVISLIAVKDQRVYGSWCGINLHLRCTLTAFEINHPIKILSKQIRLPLLR